MGYNIGVRMIEDFLAHTPSAKRCTQFEEVADVICKQGFRMFLGGVVIIKHMTGTAMFGKRTIYLYYDNILL